jgi:predicted acyl esterase
VLVFTTSVIETESDILVMADCSLSFDADSPYADLFLRICDVDPVGISTNVTDGFVRLQPNDFEPHGSAYRCRVTVQFDPTAYVFEAGHRIRLQISSGAHPNRIRNYGTDEPIASVRRPRANTITVLHEQAEPALTLAFVTWRNLTACS